MRISFIHVRICVAAGHRIPQLSFQADHLSQQGNVLDVNNFDFDEQDDDDLIFRGPIRTRRSKKVAQPRIDIHSLDIDEYRELLIKSKGRRYDRDIILETYNTPDLLTCLQSKMEATHVEEDVFAKCAQQLSFTCDDATISQCNKYFTKVSADDIALPCAAHRQSRLLPHEKKPVPSLQAGDDGALKDEEESNPGSSTSRPESSCGGQVPSIISQDSPKQVQSRALAFYSGNPAVDVTHGIIQLYKTNYKLTVDEHLPPPDTDTLCMLAVPAHVDAHAIIEFSAPFIDVIVRMRIIRDRTPNQYMVLLTFASAQDACNCFFSLNNMPFSSLQPDEICHLAFVASVDAHPAFDVDSYPADLPPHIAATTELPDCMVCLERMDESVRGVLTILCNHSFHAACLLQWEDLCCPVCRYLQTPEPQTDNKCMVCGALEDLWICLICGHVGCGRYTSEHAQHHYSDTSHNYAMALNDNRVWDYAGDYFVHRLFQNKEDGKLVEKKGDGYSAEDRDDKVNGIQLECMHLLTSQLESQRKYWEGRLAQVEACVDAGRKEMMTKQKNLETATAELDAKVMSLSSEKQSLLQRNMQLTTKFKDAIKDLSIERELNKGLRENQEEWKSKVEQLELENGDLRRQLDELKEQLRDVMFYIEAGHVIDRSDAATRVDIRDGHITVGESPTSSSGGGHRRGKGRKGR